MTDEPTEFSIALEQTPAPEPELPVELLIVGVFEEFLHLCIPDAAKADLIAELQPHLDRAGDERAGAALAHMAGRLENTAAGEALRRVICGNVESSREAARRVGCSHVAICKQEKLARRKLGLTKCP